MPYEARQRSERVLSIRAWEWYPGLLGGEPAGTGRSSYSLCKNAPLHATITTADSCWSTSGVENDLFHLRMKQYANPIGCNNEIIAGEEGPVSGGR